jgi:CheY-like chemotaxis protein
MKKSMALKKIGKRNPSKTTKDNSALPEIVYVEDEDSNWETTLLMLRQKFRLTRAKNSLEIFDLLRKYPDRFQAILMDIQLKSSDLNGIEITKVLRDKHEGELPDYAVGVQDLDIPIIFVTAYAELYKQEDLSASGGDDVITKPVNSFAMVSTLTRITMKRTRKILKMDAADSAEK